MPETLRAIAPRAMHARGHRCRRRCVRGRGWEHVVRPVDRPDRTVSTALAVHVAVSRYDFQLIEFLRTAERLDQLRRKAATTVEQTELGARCRGRGRHLYRERGVDGEACRGPGRAEGVVTPTLDSSPADSALSWLSDLLPCCRRPVLDVTGATINDGDQRRRHRVQAGGRPR